MIPDDRSHWVGRRIGAYEILGLMGAGGMGEVYRARRIDAQYDKEVAIKLVPAGHSASHILQRLRAERQILAKLDHPHIARLIDGGATEDGLPYLIMDLVDGETLDRYVEQHKLPIRERLRLFRDVCSAVSYAHQHLVVHRDLKPGNILVTADGTVKLLDFGIAKLLQPTLSGANAAQTIAGMSTLTLEFASPEQVLGKTITTASDVYSLGVVLYLLLTGRSPYRGTLQSPHELMREVCEGEPVRPIDVPVAANVGPSERVNADLDAITLRALRKEPGKRYRSVEEFAEDISHYLDGLPVMACDGQLAYRTSKFLRRRAFEVAAALLIVATLIGGIATFTHQVRVAKQQSERAERHFASVRQLAEVTMFQLNDAIADLPGSTGARQLLVNTALEYLNALDREASQDRGFRHDLATAYMKVADIQGKVNTANTGKPTAALDSYTKAIALLEPLVAADPANASAQNSLAQGYLQQSRLLVWLGDAKKAVAVSGRATHMFETLAAAIPDVSARAALADASRVHGMNLALAGGAETAVGYGTRAVEILEDLQRQQPNDLDLEYKLGVAYGTAADIQQSDGRPAALAISNDLRLKALAVDEHLVSVTGGRNATYTRSLLGDRVNLCSQHNDAGDYHRAIEYCRAAQPLLASLRTDENNAQIEVDAASLRYNLGSALLSARRFSEAAPIFEENVSALRGIAKQGDTMQVQYLLAASEHGLGAIEVQAAADTRSPRAERLRRWRKAKEWYEDAVPRFKNVTSRITLTDTDLRPMHGAVSGLARSQEEIAKLEGLAL